jgi:hypothetical protein
VIAFGRRVLTAAGILDIPGCVLEASDDDAEAPVDYTLRLRVASGEAFRLFVSPRGEGGDLAIRAFAAEIGWSPASAKIDSSSISVGEMRWQLRIGGDNKKLSLELRPVANH